MSAVQASCVDREAGGRDMQACKPYEETRVVTLFSGAKQKYTLRRKPVNKTGSTTLEPKWLQSD